jgi:hypothetical protein
MSAERERFHASVLAKRYDEAVITLNGLNMAEMLPALAAIGEQHRTALIGPLIGAVGKVFAQRIQYALSVVQDLLVPKSAPGNLAATGQVDDATAFVAVPTIPTLMFTSADAAAISVVTAINPTSIAQNREFWGLIFQRGNNFGFTSPTRSPDETAATPVVNFPSGTIGVAIYHTHGAGFTRIDGSTGGEMFSIDDRMMSKRFDLDGYLGTPDRHVLKLTKPPAIGRADLTQLGHASTLR